MFKSSYGAFRTVFTSLMILTLVSSCLVSGSDAILIKLPSPPITFPLYKNGDTLSYTVTGTATSTDSVPGNVSGEYTISWYDDNTLASPFNASIAIDNVLREQSSLNVTGLGSFSSTRYITQDTVRCTIMVNSLAADPAVPPTTPVADGQPCTSVANVTDNPNYGSVYLLAVEDGNNKKYWATTNTEVTKIDSSVIKLPPTASVDKVRIYQSPISTSTTVPQIVKYWLLANCGDTAVASATTCQERVAKVTLQTLFIKSNNNGTPTQVYGNFQTLSSTFTPSKIENIAAVSPANKLPHHKIDILAACDDPITTNIEGEFDVHPSVGNVFIRRSCSGDSNKITTFNLFIELFQVSGSFVIPSS